MSKVRKKKVSVIGLGFVGLTLCKSFIDANYDVIGIDINESRITAIDADISPISDLTDSQISAMSRKGFRVSSNYSAASDSEALIITVPTPVQEGNLPDLNHVVGAVTSIEQVMTGRPLIILESTVGPGTTGGLVRNLLEANGKRAGRDFLLGFSPERIDPGSTKGRPQDTPKVVAGFDDESLFIALQVYGEAGYKTVRAESMEAAEASKLLENTYRAVNMSLINELALGFGKMGIDITEVIRLASTKPFGFQAFYPGIGVGGHCIPVDPWHLLSAIENGTQSNSLLRSALESNVLTPAQVAGQIDNLLRLRQQNHTKPKVLILGMTYKADVNDFRESPGPLLISEIAARGYEVGYHDPFLSLVRVEKERWSGVYELDLGSALETYDAIIIAQNHRCYLDHEELASLPNVFWAAGSSPELGESIWSTSVVESDAAMAQKPSHV